VSTRAVYSIVSRWTFGAPFGRVTSEQKRWAALPSRSVPCGLNSPDRYADPLGFAQLAVCEVRRWQLAAGGGAGDDARGAGSWSVAVSGGLSVRLWKGRLEALLWESLVVDVVEPAPDRAADLVLSPPSARFHLSPAQPPPSRAGSSPALLSGGGGGGEGGWGSAGGAPAVFVYLPDGAEDVEATSFAAVVVAEDRAGSDGRWLGAPRRACHVGTRVLSYGGNSGGSGSGRILALALRDCHASSLFPPRFPGDGDLAFAAAQAIEGLSVSGARRPRSDVSLPADRAFLPAESFGAFGAISRAASSSSSSSSGGSRSIATRFRAAKNCSEVRCEETGFAPPDPLLWGHSHNACGSKQATPLDGSCGPPAGDRTWRSGERGLEWFLPLLPPSVVCFCSCCCPEDILSFRSCQRLTALLLPALLCAPTPTPLPPADVTRSRETQRRSTAWTLGRGCARSPS